MWGGENVANFENIYNQYFQDVYLFVLSLSCNETVAEEIDPAIFFSNIINSLFTKLVKSKNSI